MSNFGHLYFVFKSGILENYGLIVSTLTAESVGTVLALPIKDSFTNKIVLALPYTNTFVAVIQHYNTPILL